MEIICPKCGHQRSDADDPTIPDYQCPACGVVYAKFTLQNSQRVQAAKREMQPIQRQGLVELAACKTLETRDRGIDQLNVVNQPGFLRQHIPALAVIVFVLVSFWSYISPSIFFKELRSVALEKDPSDIAEYVDFEKLRVNVKAYLFKDSFANDNRDMSNLERGFSEIGKMVASNALDHMVSPQFIQTLFKNNATEEFDYETDYVDFDKARIIINDKVVFTLDRAGLFSWKLVGIKAKDS